jgi:hypothetical protein
LLVGGNLKLSNPSNFGSPKFQTHKLTKSQWSVEISAFSTDTIFQNRDFGSPTTPRRKKNKVSNFLWSFSSDPNRTGEIFEKTTWIDTQPCELDKFSSRFLINFYKETLYSHTTRLSVRFTCASVIFTCRVNSKHSVTSTHTSIISTRMNVILKRTSECDLYSYECDFNTPKCDFHTNEGNLDTYECDSD